MSGFDVPKIDELGMIRATEPGPTRVVTVDQAVQTVKEAIRRSGRGKAADAACEWAVRALQGLQPEVGPATQGRDTREAATDTLGAATDRPQVVNYLASAATALKALGQDLDPEHVGHLAVLLRAHWLYVERDSGQRRGVWRRSGIKGQVVHLFAKAERAFMATFGRHEVPDDDHLLDAINYAAFALRLKDDQMNGVWPWG